VNLEIPFFRLLKSLPKPRPTQRAAAAFKALCNPKTLSSILPKFLPSKLTSKDGPGSPNFRLVIFRSLSEFVP
jgi:hypothetical protein